MPEQQNTVTVVGMTPLGAPGCAVVGCAKPQVPWAKLVTNDATNGVIEYRFCAEHGQFVYEHGYSDAPIPQPWDVAT